MEHTALIEYLRRKVAETPDKAGMAEVANCTRDTLHKFAGGTIQELKYSILMGLQEYLEKTAKEGPGKKVKAHVRQPAGRTERLKPTAPSLLQMDGKEIEIPDEMDLTHDEARAVILARTRNWTGAEIKAILRGAAIHPEVANAVGAIFAEDYLEAIRICTSLAAGSMTRRRG